MKNHKKVYAEFFGLTSADRPPCERCIMLALMSLKEGVAEAVDVHHVDPRGMGGDQEGSKDTIQNLAGLCRSCHGIVEACPEENDLIKKWCASIEARKFVMRKFLFGVGEEFIKSTRKEMTNENTNNTK